MTQIKRFAMPLALVAATWAVTLWGWVRIPGGARVPLHYDLSGHVDRYGGKAEALLLLPLIAAGTTALFLILPAIDPRGSNLRRSLTALVAVATATNGMFLVIQLGTVLNATNHQVDVARWTVLASAVLFMVMGNYLNKVRSNFFVGIRTPWTLSSELSWTRTHRLGARLFAALGFVTLVTTLVSTAAGITILVSGALIVAAVSAVYSYVVWRQDPSRAR